MTGGCGCDRTEPVVRLHRWDGLWCRDCGEPDLAEVAQVVGCTDCRGDYRCPAHRNDICTMRAEERPWYPVMRSLGPSMEWAIRVAWRLLWSWR